MEDSTLSAFHLTAILRKEEDMYTSWCPEVDVASQGKTRDTALINLREAIELCLENELVRSQILENLVYLSNDCPELFCLEIDASEKA